jgi:hypothetical protein
MRARLLLALFLTAAAAHGATVIPLAQYVGSLTHIKTLLDARDAASARDEARTLATYEVDSPSGRFAADASLLNAIAHTGRADSRLDATIAALRDAAPQTNGTSTDRELLERLRRAETPDELRSGGEISVVTPDNEHVETFAKKIARALRWLWKKIEQFYDWIMSWWPQERVQKLTEASGGTAWLVGAVVLLIVAMLAILAFEVVRRSRKRIAVPVAESNPISSKEDDDPLSRGANEWERYAEQLAAAGRIREAIRAWYHAVLVTLYGSGILHFRKGRTNWEYISALAPDLIWRAEFVRLTRRFEEEWYGHDASNVEALDDCSRKAKRIIDSVRRRAAA